MFHNSPNTIIDKNHLEVGDGGVVPPKDQSWKPGQSGNPKGRPSNGGLSILEWFNQMATWPREDIAAVLTDRKASAAMVIAARRMVSAMSDDMIYGMDKDGEAVVVGERSNPGKDMDRILDRALGRPAQAVKVETGVVHVKRATTSKGSGTGGLFKEKPGKEGVIGKGKPRVRDK